MKENEITLVTRGSMAKYLAFKCFKIGYDSENKPGEISTEDQCEESEYQNKTYCNISHFGNKTKSPSCHSLRTLKFIQLRQKGGT